MYLMKKFMARLLTIVMLTVSLNATVFGSGSAQSLSTADFDLGMAKGIQYFNNGQYYEARDEFLWFWDYNWGRMNEGQQQYVIDYLNSAKERVSEIEKKDNLTQQQFDDGLRKGIDYFNNELWIDARNEFQWFCDSNWWRMNRGQRKYVLDYLEVARQNAAEYEETQLAMNQTDFDNGMRKGIDYFNKGMYYEARDEFQWFCDDNWSGMNRGQRQYALDYLGAAKQKLAEYEKAQLSISQTDFDNGMKKGISYFNKGMYYEARDEFQWFCDANWGKMNSGQRQYALDYLDSAKRNIQNMSTQNNGTWYHGGAYATSGNVSFWQYSLSVSNITSSSLNVNYFAMSQSSIEVKNARLYKQSDGSYAGSAVIPYEGSIYIKISIISNSHIKLTYGDSYYSETVHFYK